MKKLSIILLASILAVFLAAGSVCATAMLSLDDNAGNSVLITDGNADGVVSYNGSLGDWNLNITTGFTKPIVGSATEPILDLNSVNAYSGSVYSTLSIEFTETDFIYSPTLSSVVFAVGGVTDGNNNGLVWASGGNGTDPFEDNLFISGLSDTGSGAFSFTDSGVLRSPQSGSYFSMGIGINVVLTEPGTSSFDAALAATPEPTTILLLGAGLVGLAGFGRKKFKNLRNR